MYYHHTQKGKLIRIIMAILIVICIVIAGANGWNAPIGFSLYGLVFILSMLTWLLGSLTVEVGGEELRHYFGPGFWKKSYLLSDIESVKQVRNSWLFGWGIRLTPHGWLYNVSGLDAVEINLRSGRKFRIGTDDPANLLTALQPASC